MKLRKALEKAREERQGQCLSDDSDNIDGSNVNSSVAYDRGRTASVKQDSGSAQWTSPSYDRSLKINLDENVLRENKCFCYFPDSAEASYFKVLRAQIRQRSKAKGWKTMMVTSPTANAGKTLTAVNLAFIFAKEFNQTVLLVDADLKRQDVHKRLGYASSKGLADYLIDDRQLNDIVVWPGVDKLTIISGGETLNDSTELLASPKMELLAEEMKNRYSDRYIIFDAPPVLGTADAISFAPLVDCVLMVVESGATSQRDVQEALKLIPADKMLGCVLNRHGLVGGQQY